MLEILKILPTTFIPIFVAIDIFVLLPMFISITTGMAISKKRVIIHQSVFTAMIVSLAFVAVGEIVFRVLRITVNDFKIAGGLLLLVLAILELIRHGGSKIIPHETVGVVPIGVPLIVGPAVLTTLIVLIDHFGIIPTIISLVLNLLIVWIALISAERIVKIIGKNGIVAISKVMAIFLASIAVMMMRLGIEGIFK